MPSKKCSVVIFVSDFWFQLSANVFNICEIKCILMFKEMLKGEGKMDYVMGMCKWIWALKILFILFIPNF